jgi:hypothetical protein
VVSVHTRSAAVGFAAAAVLAAGLGTAPAAAAETAVAPRPKLTRTTVTPSSCPGADKTLAYDRRPTLTATTAAHGGSDRKLRFEIWPTHALDLSSAEREEWGYTGPHAAGSVAPTRPGGNTFAWRPKRELGSDYSWRARVLVDGKPATAWSSWHRFSIANSDIPTIRRCDIAGDSLEHYWFRAQQTGHSMAEIIADDMWLRDFGSLVLRLTRQHPDQVVAGSALGDGHSRRGWIAAVGPATPQVRTAVARFRAAHPGSRIRLLEGRDYTEKGIYERAAAMTAALRSEKLVVDAFAYPEMRTGTMGVHATRAPKVTRTPAQLRAALLSRLQATAKGYSVVKADPGAVAGPDVQPVRVVVSTTGG